MVSTADAEKARAMRKKRETRVIALVTYVFMQIVGRGCGCFLTLEIVGLVVRASLIRDVSERIDGSVFFQKPITIEGGRSSGYSRELTRLIGAAPVIHGAVGVDRSIVP